MEGPGPCSAARRSAAISVRGLVTVAGGRESVAMRLKGTDACLVKMRMMVRRCRK